MKTRKRTIILGCLLITIVLPVLIVLVLVGGYWIWNARSGRLVDEELAKIRAAGEPVTAEELNAFYKTPEPSKDCTELWLKAIKPFDGEEYSEACGELPIVGSDDNDIPSPGEPWPDQAAVEKFLEKYADSMTLMYEAARRGGAARYPLDFRDGFMTFLDHVQWFRVGVRMLTLETHVRVRQGDPHAAVESIRTMLCLGESLEQEPTLVSQLVRMACNGIVYNLVGELLTDADFSDDDLAMLQADFAGVNYDDGLRRAMIGERSFGIYSFQDPAHALGDEWFDDEFITLMLRLRPNDDLLLYLDLMNQTIAAAKLSDPKRLRVAEQWEDRVKAICDNAGFVTKIRYTYTMLLTPAVSAVFQAAARTDALNRLAITRIALERYRRKHGKLPEKLGQLVPEFLDAIPIDPFDGRPIRYVIRDGRPVVYSIGNNRIDDGGQGDYSCEPDILFPTPPCEDEE